VSDARGRSAGSPTRRARRRAPLTAAPFDPRRAPGTCNYYDVSDGKGEVKAGGAWVYKTPKPAAAEIANHVAFYPFVTHVK
jgi:hypothetical protein